MNKKKFLTESDRKKIVSDKEKAILESFAKTFNKIKRIDENEVAGIETKQLEKKAFDFANSPEMGQLVDKILANAKPEDLQQIKNAVGSVSEGMMCENDFSSFLNIAPTHRLYFDIINSHTALFTPGYSQSLKSSTAITP